MEEEQIVSEEAKEKGKKAGLYKLNIETKIL